MSKLREEAVIQCPAPIVSPYPFFRENIYESQRGLRHTLCDNDQYNYVAWIPLEINVTFAGNANQRKANPS